MPSELGQETLKKLKATDSQQLQQFRMKVQMRKLSYEGRVLPTNPTQEIDNTEDAQAALLLETFYRSLDSMLDLIAYQRDEQAPSRGTKILLPPSEGFDFLQRQLTIDGEIFSAVADQGDWQPIKFYLRQRALLLQDPSAFTKLTPEYQQRLEPYFATLSRRMPPSRGTSPFRLAEQFLALVPNQTEPVDIVDMYTRYDGTVFPWEPKDTTRPRLQFWGSKYQKPRE